MASTKRKGIDLTDRYFGFLKAVCEAPRLIDHRGHPLRVWVCECVCGALLPVRQDCLVRSSVFRTCGCRESFYAARRHLKHGKSFSSEYRSWHSMRVRCTRKSAINYKDYGGRGITICDRWSDFRNFYADMGPKPSPQHSLDRIDNDGPYCPENCRWSSTLTQNRNRRNAITILFDGKSLSLQELAEITGIDYYTLYWRYKTGKKGPALTAPPSRSK